MGAWGGTLVAVALWGVQTSGLAAWQDTPKAGDPSPSALPAPATIPTASAPTEIAPILSAGTPIFVTVAEDISSHSHHLGDRFIVVVAEDVVAGDRVFVPKGTTGHGEVTFVTRKGGFGKPGILGIALRQLELNGRSFALDGRYREEGKDGDGAASATMFAVGIFAGLVKGETSVIPKGHLLKARTGEDIAWAVPAPPESAGPTPEPATAADPAPVAANAPVGGIAPARADAVTP